MQKVPTEFGIVLSLATHTARKVTRKAVNALKRIKSEAAGDDSGLDTVWNEYCVQVRYQESAFFSIYEDMIEEILDSLINELEDHEKEALWFITEEAEKWENKASENRDTYPVAVEAISRLILHEYLAPFAMDFSNRKIRRFAQREFDLD